MDRSWEYINRSQTNECGIFGTETAQFLFWEYINGLFRCSAWNILDDENGMMVMHDGEADNNDNHDEQY